MKDLMPLVPTREISVNPDDKLKDKAETITQTTMKVDDDLLDFGLISCRQLKSNSIAIVRKLKNGDNQLLGMGCSQPNRVNSTQLALSRSVENLKLEFSGSDSELDGYIQKEMGEAILVSDAFFPFPDNIELAGAAGIKKIFQPGGSIRDKSVVAKCDELGIAMIFTGLRHFKH